MEDVRQVIHCFGTHGYRRVWGVLRHKHPRPNGQATNRKHGYASLALRPNTRDVMQQLEEWFNHYNTNHPQSALQYLPSQKSDEKQALTN